MKKIAVALTATLCAFTVSVFFGLLAAGQDRAEPPRGTDFTDVTETAGLKDARGNRIAWGDFNNDGWDDLLVDGRMLFKNNGDGTFTDVTKQAGLANEGSGAVWADFDNDGFLDFVVIRAKGGLCRLWKNNRNGTFSDVTEAMRFDSPGNAPTAGAAWGDYDRDGFVDLYVANYETAGKELGKGNPDILWKNEKGKRFVDATEAAGIKPPKPLCGRGVAWADFDNDGLLDIYVSNYRLNPNLLWKNNGDGTFADAAAATGSRGDERPNVFGHTIGSAWADFDNDGLLDLVCGQLAHPNFRRQYGHPMTMLYKNGGPPGWKFTNLNPNGKAGIKFEETHSSTAVADFDNDGLVDFYVTSIYEGRPSFLYRNKGDMTFEDVTARAGVNAQNGWGCAWADFDNDGDMDLAVVSVGKGGVKLFRNDAPKGGNRWLKVKLVGTDCNSAGIGARVTVKAGQVTHTRQIEGGTGTTCQNSMICHFGLGEHSKEVELTVRWPCGKTHKTTSKPGKLILIKEQKGK